MSSPYSPHINLFLLIGLFYDDASPVGRFSQVAGEKLLPAERELLDHNAHMTVTLEHFHDCPVDVRVLEDRVEGDLYLRKILLTRQSDDRVVQYGIVRLNMAVLSEEVEAEIRKKQTPLGRILIRRNVLRKVDLDRLFRIECGPDLCEAFSLPPGSMVAGRTALIHCNGEPAIELLEIVNAQR